MQEVVVKTYCDYPECADAWKAESTDEASQKTTRTTVLVYTNGKGRKPEPVEVLFCADHLDQLKGLFQWLQRYDLSKEN